MIRANDADGVGRVLAGISINYWLGTTDGAPISCNYGGDTSLTINSRSISIDLVKSFVDYKLEYDIPLTMKDSNYLIRKNFSDTFP